MGAALLDVQIKDYRGIRARHSFYKLLPAYYVRFGMYDLVGVLGLVYTR